MSLLRDGGGDDDEVILSRAFVPDAVPVCWLVVARRKSA
jgi:hypothetical protein